LTDNVLSNDWDGDFDSIEASLDVGPSNGTLSYFNSDGSFEYVPAADWSGSDSFTYHVNDGVEDSGIATVWIDVTNQAPIAEDDFFEIIDDTPLNENVSNNDWDGDFDSLEAFLATGPTNGTLNNFNSDGSFEYLPDGDWSGTDSFSYYVNDGVEDSNIATVWIDVKRPEIIEPIGVGAEGGQLHFLFSAETEFGEITRYSVDVDDDGTYDVIYNVDEFTLDRENVAIINSDTLHLLRGRFCHVAFPN